MGKYQYEQKIQEHKEAKLKASEFIGTIPDGGSIPEKKEYIPPWRSDKIDMSLANLSESKKKEYIMTGQK